MLAVNLTGSFLGGQKSGFAVSSTDLVNGMTPTYPEAANAYSATFEGGPIGNFTDGTMGVGTDAGSAGTNCIFDINHAFLLEYQLPLAGSPTGYNLTGIDVYSGHQDNRSNMHFDIFVETVSNPGVWTSLSGGANFTYAPNLGNGAGRAQITDTTGTLATGVKGIRFKDNGNGDVYRELDVIGVPAVPPAAPTGVSGIPGDQSAAIAWTQLPGLTYTVKRSTLVGGPFTAIPAATNITANSFTDTGLTNGTVYYYVVSATNPSGEGLDSSPPVAVQAGLTAPLAPTNVVAASGIGQVTVSWTAPAFATSYTVLRSDTPGGPFTPLAGAIDIAATNFSDTTGLAGSIYYYAVTAKNAAGPSPQSAVDPGQFGMTGTGTGLDGSYYNNRTFSGTPVTQVATTVSYDWGEGSPIAGIAIDQFTVRWVGQVEAQYTGQYYLGTDTDDGGRIFLNGVQVSDGWFDQGPGTIEWSANPVNLVAGQKYAIVMEMYESGGGAVARLYWRTADGATPQQIIPQSQLYQFTSPPTAVTGLVADVVVGDSVTQPYMAKLTWATDPSTQLGYKIERALSASGPWTLLATIAPTSQYLDVGINANTQYFYRVIATNAVGDALPSNVDDVTTSGTVLTGAGVAAHYFVGSNRDQAMLGNPTYIRVEPQLDTLVYDTTGNGTPVATYIPADQFSGRWTGKITAPTSGVYTFIGRTDDGLRYWIDGELLIDHWQDRGPTDSSSVIYLVGGQSYNFIYEFFENGGGEVAQFDWIAPGGTRQRIPTSALTAQSDIPTAPTGLAAAVTGVNHVQLKWNDVSKSEFQYVIERATDAGFTTGLTRFVRAIDTTVFNDFDLAPGTYYYRVSAVNYDGSATSGTVTVTPVAAASGGSLSGFSGTGTAVDLTGEGQADWVHYGRNTGYGYDRKAGVPAQITRADLIGGALTARFDAPAGTGYTWSNGAPLLAASNELSGIGTAVDNSSYRFTVPANTNFKTVKIYLGAYRAQGTLTATLSDGSAAPYVDFQVDTNALASERVSYVYTLNFQAASANQDLIIDFKKTANYGDGGNVTIQAVTLSDPSGIATPSLTAVQVDNDVKLSWSQVFTGSGYLLQSSLDGTTWTDLAVIGTSVQNSFFHNDLAPGTVYYRVKTTGFSGDSEYSLPLRFTVSPSVSPVYANFSSTAGLVLNGNANNTVVAGAITLTQPVNSQTSSFFTELRQRVNRWNAQFDFQTRDAFPNDSNADGFTFTIQNVANTALGGGGGSLAYQGLTNSIAVKFDIYDNVDQTGLLLNGAHPDTVAVDVRPYNVNLDSGGIWRVQMSYDGSTLVVAIYDPANPERVQRSSYFVDIPNTIGNDVAFVGFTGATGGLNLGQDILNFSFVNTALQTINTTNDPDTVVVKLVGTDTKIWVNTDSAVDPATYSYPRASLNQIELNTLAGNDTITIDYSGGDPLPLHGMKLDASFDSGDALQLLGGAGNETFGLGEQGVGSLLNWVTVNSVESITLNAGGGTDLLHIHGTMAGDFFEINSANTFTWFVFSSTPLTYSNLENITLFGGPSDDTLTVNVTPDTSPIFFGGETGVDTINISSGVTYTFAGDTTGFNNNMVVNQSTGSTVKIVGKTNLDNYYIAGNAQVQLTGSRTFVRFDDGTVDPFSGGTIDIGSNGLINATGGTTGFDLLSQLLAAGRNGGAWNGPGLTSSAARNAIATPLAAITDVYIFLNDNAGQPIWTSFYGQTLAASDVLVKFTYKGDADLNGVIDIDDYFLLDTAYALRASIATPNYKQGDFNDDNVINADDYFIIDKSFLGQGAALSGAWSPTAVPILPPVAGSPASPFSSAPIAERDWDNADVLA